MSVSQLFQPNSYNLFCNSLTTNSLTRDTTGNNKGIFRDNSPRNLIADGEYYPAINGPLSMSRSSLDKSIFVTGTSTCIINAGSEVEINLRRSTVGQGNVSEVVVPDGLIKLTEKDKHFSITWLDTAATELIGDYRDLNLTYTALYKVTAGTGGVIVADGLFADYSATEL